MSQFFTTSPHKSGLSSNYETDMPGIEDEVFVSDNDINYVLIIDDEPEITEEIAEKLERHGFDCLTATGARAGLDMVISQPAISIVLADVRMPEMDGLTLCREIKSKIPTEREVALIIMTGHAGMAEAIEAIKVGALDFLTKPLSPDFLLHAVKRAEQHINACTFKREFNERLKSEVTVKTVELQQQSIELEDAISQLVLANQIKDEFLTMMNHELRTPLSTIIGFAEIMESEASNLKQRECVERIKDAGLRLMEMVTSMLDMVALETGTLMLKQSEMNIAELIEQTIKIYRSKAEQAEITIDTDNVSEIPCFIDPLRISQALGRLIDNAIKFSSAGGVIKISAQQLDNDLILCVEDDGIGMSEQELEQACTPLSQLNASSTKSHQGIGVGLSLAKMFAELHGGSLSIDSIPGQGTNIIIALPR